LRQKVLRLQLTGRLDATHHLFDRQRCCSCLLRSFASTF
jgi:hypothetical protein